MLLSKLSARYSVKKFRSQILLNALKKSIQKARYLATTTGYAGRWLDANKEHVQIEGEIYPVDSMTNITPVVLQQMEKKLHLAGNNPISIVKRKIYDYFQREYVSESGDPLFTIFDDLSPVTTPVQNFDTLLIPKGHRARSELENYYLNENAMLRCHTTAHAPDLIEMGHRNFLLSGDVYRRDKYDSTHSPIFHQVEVQCLFTKEDLFGSDSSKSLFDANTRASTLETEEKQHVHSTEAVQVMSLDLKSTVEGVVFDLLGHNVKYRWNPYYIQFGRPAYEMEILYEGNWLEILGASILKQEIVDRAGAMDKITWSCGFGIDRLAMVLYGIPDIRLLRNKNAKFSRQFASMLFEPHCSSCPTFYREIAFQHPQNVDGTTLEYDFYELVRIAAESVVQKAELVDKFSRNQRYRIAYKSWDKVMDNEEVDIHHNALKELAESKLNLKLLT